MSEIPINHAGIIEPKTHGETLPAFGVKPVIQPSQEQKPPLAQNVGSLKDFLNKKKSPNTLPPHLQAASSLSGSQNISPDVAEFARTGIPSKDMHVRQSNPPGTIKTEQIQPPLTTSPQESNTENNKQ